MENLWAYLIQYGMKAFTTKDVDFASISHFLLDVVAILTKKKLCKILALYNLSLTVSSQLLIWKTER